MGTGPLEEELKEQASQKTSRIAFGLKGVFPMRNSRYYRQARLFVLPSVWEGHPLTLLEVGLLNSLSLRVTWKGVAEFVEHGQTGYLIPPKSPEQIGAMLFDIASQIRRRHQNGLSNAYELAKAEYSWDGVAARTNQNLRRDHKMIG